MQHAVNYIKYCNKYLPLKYTNFTNWSSTSSSTSTAVVQTVYSNSEEAIRKAEELKNKTEELQAEVKSFKPEFPVEVQRTVATKEDVLVLMYKDLKDTIKILNDVSEMFEGLCSCCPGL